MAGAKLIEGLMSSKWAQSDTAYIKSRDGAIRFCQKLLEKQYLIGGKKIEMKKSKKDDDEEEEAEEEETKKVWLVCLLCCIIDLTLLTSLSFSL